MIAHNRTKLPNTCPVQLRAKADKDFCVWTFVAVVANDAPGFKVHILAEH